MTTAELTTDSLVRECLYCKKPYQPKKWWQQYCSKYCGYRYNWEKNHPEGRNPGRPRKVRPVRTVDGLTSNLLGPSTSNR
jgi:hypothetical protein